MSRRARYALMALMLAVVIGVFYLPRLWRTVEAPTQTEEQARRAVTQQPIATPTDVKVTAKMFWAAPGGTGALAPVDVEVALSADPVQRCRQLLDALIPSPTQAQRTLPADTTLLDFYLLPDGTAIADFADTISAGTPSGILSEQMAVDSITRTLGSSVPEVRRMKILIHGQEADTLAGHLDLTGFFPVGSGAAANPVAPAATTAPTPGKPAPQVIPH
jgi:spore germination protein GerM